MRILLIEDDPQIASFVERSLRESGFVIDHVQTAKAAEARIVERDYAAIVLDLGLPDRDGFDLLGALQGQGLSTPVFILPARRAVDDRVRGLEQGGGDYLTKPFAAAELLARLRNLVKRHQAVTPSSTKLLVLDLKLNLLSREAVRGTPPASDCTGVRPS